MTGIEGEMDITFNVIKVGRYDWRVVHSNHTDATPVAVFPTYREAARYADEKAGVGLSPVQPCRILHLLGGRVVVHKHDR